MITQNPNDKNANIILTGNDLTAKWNGSWISVRSTESKSSGVWYSDVTLAVCSSYISTGIGLKTATLNNYVGSDSFGYGYHNNSGGVILNNTAQVGYIGVTLVTGNVLGIGLDLDRHELQFYRNGVAIGQSLNIPDNTYFVMGSAYSSGDQQIVNFGSSVSAYPAPYGYQWWEQADTYYGIVSEFGIPVARPVRVYDRLTGAKLVDTTSNPITGEFQFSAPSTLNVAIVCINNNPNFPDVNDIWKNRSSIININDCNFDFDYNETTNMYYPIKKLGQRINIV